MSFTALTTGEIATGEPVQNATQTKIKNNFDDHETRIETLEGASAVYPSIIFRVNGQYYVKTDVLKTTANFTLTIAGVRILTDQAGTAGTLQIDILKSNGGGAFTTIFTTPPSISYSLGSNQLSTNAILNPSNVNVIAGDILRLDITSAQTTANGFLVRIDYTR